MPVPPMPALAPSWTDSGRYVRNPSRPKLTPREVAKAHLAMNSEIVTIREESDSATVWSPISHNTHRVNQMGHCDCHAYQFRHECWHAEAVQIVAEWLRLGLTPNLPPEPTDYAVFDVIEFPGQRSVTVLIDGPLLSREEAMKQANSLRGEIVHTCFVARIGDVHEAVTL